MEEQESIFRKQSLERVSSPEQLNDYIKAATPSVWFMLSAIIILLFGLCLWGIFGRLETAVETGAVANGDVISVFIPEQYEEEARSSLPLYVRIEGKRYELTEISASAVHLTSEHDPYAMHAGGFSAGDFVYMASAHGDIPDGAYEATVILSSVAPVFFVLN